MQNALLHTVKKMSRDERCDAKTQYSSVAIMYDHRVCVGVKEQIQNACTSAVAFHSDPCFHPFPPLHFLFNFCRNPLYFCRDPIQQLLYRTIGDGMEFSCHRLSSYTTAIVSDLCKSTAGSCKSYTENATVGKSGNRDQKNATVGKGGNRDQRSGCSTGNPPAAPLPVPAGRPALRNFRLALALPVYMSIRRRPSACSDLPCSLARPGSRSRLPLLRFQTCDPGLFQLCRIARPAVAK